MIKCTILKYSIKKKEKENEKNSVQYADYFITEDHLEHFETYQKKKKKNRSAINFYLKSIHIKLPNIYIK